MAYLKTPDGDLYRETLDATPPWVEEPETILFCHGVATNADIWSGWLPGLIDRFRIVRFDTRGFGRSAAPATDYKWSLDRFADDILAIAEAAGVGRFHLVGESLGGTVSLKLAARGDPRILSVTCASTSHRGGSINHAREWRSFIAEHGMAAWSEQMMERRFAEGAAPAPVLEWFHSIQAATKPDVLLGAVDALIGADLAEELAGVGVPALILAPDASPFVPVTVAAELASLLPDARLRTFPGVRHGVSCSHGAECAAELRRFITG